MNKSAIISSVTRTFGKFGLKAKKPIDTRLVFATKTEMDA